MLNDAPVLEYHSGSSILRLFSTSPIPELGAELRTSRNIILKALFEPDMKWRLVEEFGSDCCEVQEDGRLLLIRNYVDMDNLTMWMLTFGDKAEVIKLQEVREKIKAIAGSMIRKYGGK